MKVTERRRSNDEVLDVVLAIRETQLDLTKVLDDIRARIDKVEQDSIAMHTNYIVNQSKFDDYDAIVKEHPVCQQRMVELDKKMDQLPKNLGILGSAMVGVAGFMTYMFTWHRK